MVKHREHDPKKVSSAARAYNLAARLRVLRV